MPKPELPLPEVPDTNSNQNDEEPPIPDLPINSTNTTDASTTNSTSNKTDPDSSSSSSSDHDHASSSESEPMPDPIPGDNDFPIEMPPGHHRRLLQSTSPLTIYGAPLTFKIVITGDSIFVVYNNTSDGASSESILFNSTDYQASNANNSNFDVNNLVKTIN